MIAFGSDRDAGFDLYVMKADGTNQVRLTDSPAAELRPTWSPDGSRIAFQSNLDGNDDIHMMDADGSNTRQLTFNSAFDGEPAWSRDGDKIMFTSNRGGDFEVYVMDADGSNPINLTNNPAVDAGYPVWSPDGTHIAFMSDRDGNFEIYVMAADGTDPVRLTDHHDFDANPYWSPDGERIAFMSNRDGNNEIYVMRADGTDLKRLTENPALDTSPVWSPDGKSLLVTSLREGNPEIYLVDLESKYRDPGQQAIVYEGDTALAKKSGGLWSVKYVPDAPLGTVGYEALHFAFHPGDTRVSQENSFRVTLGEVAIDVLGESLVNAGIDLDVRDWQVVELPLEPIEIRGAIDEVVFSGNLTGTFYLDDIRFLAATPPQIAVKEEISSSLPSQFALQQNYPNPFNSGTVIHFALPRPADVELAVFNLAGQKVIRLVHGPRPAGSYTLHWDGHDQEGRQLASGVYLVRLQVARGLEETRKMLLIR